MKTDSIAIHTARMDVIIDKYGYLVDELMGAAYLADKIQDVYDLSSNHDHIKFLRNIPGTAFDTAPDYRTVYSQVPRTFGMRGLN